MDCCGEFLETSGRRAVRILHLFDDRSGGQAGSPASDVDPVTTARVFQNVRVRVSRHSHTGDVTMVKLAAAVKKFAAAEEGASLVEYSLLVALLAAASIAILYGLGQNVKGTYTQVNNAVGTANVGITSAGS